MANQEPTLVSRLFSWIRYLHKIFLSRGLKHSLLVSESHFSVCTRQLKPELTYNKQLLMIEFVHYPLWHILGWYVRTFTRERPVPTCVTLYSNQTPQIYGQSLADGSWRPPRRAQSPAPTGPKDETDNLGYSCSEMWQPENRECDGGGGGMGQYRVITDVDAICISSERTFSLLTRSKQPCLRLT